jgi:hypothetical protein
MTPMADKIFALLRERDNVSFAELDRLIEGFHGGDVSLSLEGPKHSNIIMWTNMTKEGADAIEELRAAKLVRADPSVPLVYLVDGAMLKLPLAKARHHYKQPHWAPTVLNLASRPKPAMSKQENRPKKHWPYGANDEATQAKLTEWAGAHKLRYAPNAHCLHWIAKGRCGVSLCREDRSQHHWMDHISGWTRDGKPAVLLCQPYNLSADDLADLVRVHEQFGFDVRIHGGGWYGHGTVCIELRKR